MFFFFGLFSSVFFFLSHLTPYLHQPDLLLSLAFFFPMPISLFSEKLYSNHHALFPHIPLSTTTMARWWCPWPCLPCSSKHLRKPTPYSSKMLPTPRVWEKNLLVHKRSLQICPSSVEFTSVRNWTSKWNESVNNECNEVNSTKEQERPPKKNK